MTLFGTDMIDIGRVKQVSEEYKEQAPATGTVTPLSLCGSCFTVSGSTKFEQLPPIATKRPENARKGETEVCFTVVSQTPKMFQRQPPSRPTRPPKPRSVKRTRTGYP